jgi:hypothetical protein
MKERAKADPKFKPKAHVYLALMRSFASKGEMEIVRSLRQQMVPGSGGHVSAEDRAEADELWIENAVNAGQVSAKNIWTFLNWFSSAPLEFVQFGYIIVHLSGVPRCLH